MVEGQDSADIGREDRGRGRWWSRKRVQGSQSREAEDGAGIRRPKEARRGNDKEAAEGRITGEIEWLGRGQGRGAGERD